MFPRGGTSTEMYRPWVCRGTQKATESPLLSCDPARKACDKGHETDKRSAVPVRVVGIAQAFFAGCSVQGNCSRSKIPPPTPGSRFVAALARWCVRHRLVAVLLWLLPFAGATAGAAVAGSAYSNDYATPGTESSRATQL